MKDRLVWVRTLGSKAVAAAALESGVSHLLLEPKEVESIGKLGRFQPLVLQNGHVTRDGAVIGSFVEIASKGDEERAAKLAGKDEFVVVRARDWKIIPLENLIAQFQKTKSKLLAEVQSAKEAKLFFETLEVGVDGVVLASPEPKEVRELATLLRGLEATKLELVAAKVTRVQDVGVGERVCVDTCSMLSLGEGMLVGSAAAGLFLVHSESLHSEYVNARPFRVNAGAVHSYVMGPGGRTSYLSEVAAGSVVLAVNAKGETRRVVVGRAKIETRPLLLVEAEIGGKKFTAALQNAETIRLVRPMGEAVSVVDLKVGDHVLLHRASEARHFGHAIQERVVER